MADKMANRIFYNKFSIRNPKKAMIVTGLIGSVLLSISVYVAVSTYQFISHAIATQGTVVAMKTNRNGNNSTYLPTFEFSTNSGDTMRSPGFQMSSEYDFQNGAQIEILYDPNHPQIVRINNWSDTWQRPLLLLFIATFFLSMSVMAGVLHRRWLRERPSYANKGVYFAPEETIARQITRTTFIYGGLYLKKPKKVALLTGIPGLLMLVFGVAIKHVTDDFMDNAIATKAQVISVEEIDSAGSDSKYRPTLEFTDSQGNIHSVRSALSSTDYNYELGTTLTILVDSRDPSNVRMDHWLETGGLGISLLVGALLFLPVAIYAWIIHQRQVRALREQSSDSIVS